MAARVAVLMGGRSAEREVSLVTGAAVARTLRARGHDVATLDAGHKIGQHLAELGPDVVFNALHGRYGEDGAIQGLLEVMGLPYTHSGVLASALAMDKPVSRTLFAAAGLPCPPGGVARRDEILAGVAMEPPYVVKPVNEGSSVGVVLVAGGDKPPFDSEPWHYGETVLVEKYIPGRELSVAVRDGEPLGVIEIRSTGPFYDYAAKYGAGGSTHQMPARIDETAYARCMDVAARAHACLGCRGVTRADLRWDESDGDGDGVYLLEVNTQPGLTPTSLVPEIAAHAGIEFGDLVEWMLEDAGCER